MNKLRYFQNLGLYNFLFLVYMVWTWFELKYLTNSDFSQATLKQAKVYGKIVVLYSCLFSIWLFFKAAFYFYSKKKKLRE